MTIDKLKHLIYHCTFSNDNNKLRKALNAVDKLVATLQPTSIDNIHLCDEVIIKGKVCTIYNNNYTKNGKEFKTTLVELLIKHKE